MQVARVLLPGFALALSGCLYGHPVVGILPAEPQEEETVLLGLALAGASAVSAGHLHVCARLTSGAARCWGSGQMLGLGLDSTEAVGDDETPASAGDVNLGGASLSAISVTRGHTCALLNTQDVRCWGDGSVGQLGNGGLSFIGDDPGELPIATDVNLGGSGVVEISSGSLAGFGYNCARLSSGDVRCWGENGAGQLGYGNMDRLGEEPGDLPLTANVNITGASGASVVQLALGGGHSCALLDNGAVRCWGDNLDGQLGIGGTDNVGDGPGEMPPADVNLGGASAVQIAAGRDHACAILTTGAVRCWGSGGSGRLGTGGTQTLGDNPGELPLTTDADLGGTRAVQIAAGDFHTCALLEDDSVRCWGFGGDGQLGYGNTQNIGDGPGEMPPPPVPVLY